MVFWSRLRRDGYTASYEILGLLGNSLVEAVYLLNRQLYCRVSKKGRMKIQLSSKRRLFPFRTEAIVRAEVNRLGSIISALEALKGILSPDELLKELDKKVLTNIRGRPAVTQGGESSEETLLVIEGIRPATEEDFTPFVISIVTKFLEFRGKDILYSIRTRTPAHLEWENLSLKELLSQPELQINSLLIEIDYFEPKLFSFLGTRLPELRERFQLNAQAKGGSFLLLEDLDYKSTLSPRLWEMVSHLNTFSPELKEGLMQKILGKQEIPT